MKRENITKINKKLITLMKENFREIFSQKH